MDQKFKKKENEQPDHSAKRVQNWSKQEQENLEIFYQQPSYFRQGNKTE